MFTGLVETMGKVVDLQPGPAGPRLTIDPGDWHHRTRAGESIAVNGCCLSHAPNPRDNPYYLTFDVVKQTLDRTTLGSLRPGDLVNLEPCLTPDSRIGGHFVQGHIDSVTTVRDVRTAGEYRLSLCMDQHLCRHIFPAGSVAVDGVSLTVASVNIEHMTFDVALIPMTLKNTTLARLRAGDQVNIETDMLIRGVVHMMTLLHAARPTSPSDQAVTAATARAAPHPAPIRRPARPEAQ